MDKENKIQLFEDKRIRTAWDEEKEEWYFSIVDVISVLTESDNPRRYWSDLKRKLEAEGSELYEKIVQLKMTASDGKKRLTDVAETTATELRKITKPESFEENRSVAISGGEVAGNARRDIEQRTGKSVISSKNAEQLMTVMTELLEDGEPEK